MDIVGTAGGARQRQQEIFWHSGLPRLVQRVKTFHKDLVIVTSAGHITLHRYQGLAGNTRIYGDPVTMGRRIVSWLINTRRHTASSPHIPVTTLFRPPDGNGITPESHPSNTPFVGVRKVTKLIKAYTKPPTRKSRISIAPLGVSQGPAITSRLRRHPRIRKYDRQTIRAISPIGVVIEFNDHQIFRTRNLALNSCSRGLV